MSAKLCRSKEGGATGTAVVRLGRCPWATATFDMKTSKHRAITIKWNFIFTPQSVSRVASKLWCLFLRVAHDLAYRREVSIRLVFDGTTQSAHSHPGEKSHTKGIVQTIKLGVLTGQFQRFVQSFQPLDVLRCSVKF